MTEVSKQTIINAGSPYLGGRVKGDFSNRLDCAIEKAKNNFNCLAKDVVLVGGATAAAGYGVLNSSKAANLFGGGVQKMANWFAKYSPKNKFGEVVVKFANKLNKLPNKYKALGLVLLAGLGASKLVNIQGAYNNGKIDQKYHDQAIVDKHQKIQLEI